MREITVDKVEVVGGNVRITFLIKDDNHDFIEERIRFISPDNLYYDIESHAVSMYKDKRVPCDT